MAKRPQILAVLSGLFASLGLAPIAHAQTLGTGQDVSLPWMRLLIGLVLFAFMVLIALAFVRMMKSGQLSSGLTKKFAKAGIGVRGDIDIIETKRLSMHADVCVFRHKGTEYLVLLSQNQCQLLDQSDVSEETMFFPGRAGL